MRKNLAIGFLSLTLLIPSVSHAARDYGRDAVNDLFGNVYFAAKYGEITIAEDVPENGSDIRNLGFVFGKHVNEIMSVEFEYTFTVSKDDNYGGSNSGITDGTADTLGLFLVATSPGDVYVKGRVGYTRVEQEFESAVSDLDGVKNVYGAAVGVGAGVKIGKQGAIELEYTVFPTRDDVTIDFGGAIGEVDFDLESDFVSLAWVWRVE